MTDSIRIERAEARDNRFIAEMIAISSDGIAHIEWQQQADEEGVAALAIGARTYAAEEGDYSFRNCWIARSGRAEPVGMILSFALTEANRSQDAKPPPYADDDIYAPYKYLEAVNSWYICGVTVVPDQRGRDIGKRLMERAMQDGREAGFDNCSLIAVASKTALLDYYRSLGFEITRRAPIVPHPQIDASGDAVLMETNPGDQASQPASKAV